MTDGDDDVLCELACCVELDTEVKTTVDEEVVADEIGIDGLIGIDDDILCKLACCAVDSELDTKVKTAVDEKIVEVVADEMGLDELIGINDDILCILES